MTDTQAPRRIAIACQGGGSHTAFTAGALQSLLRHEQTGAFQISALSGTSGGALCALLAWVGLVKQRTQGWDVAQTTELIEALWMDNAAQSPAEESFNKSVITMYNLQGRGLMPSFAVSPYALKATSMIDMLKNAFPRPEFLDLKALLAKHVDLATVQQPTINPRLLIGAINVQSGYFHAFDSVNSEITLDAVQASATLPLLSQAVKIENESYWDGLFSQNPPIRELLQGIPVPQRPQELWVIRINPQRREEAPTTIHEIEDRRNELSGNLSLNQEIYFLERVNSWLRSGHLKVEGLEPVDIRWIEMEPEFSKKLDYASKLNRSAAFIKNLIAYGQSRADAFLAERFPAQVPAVAESLPA